MSTFIWAYVTFASLSTICTLWLLALGVPTTSSLATMAFQVVSNIGCIAWAIWLLAKAGA